jgi:hypothetical protein
MRGRARCFWFGGLTVAAGIACTDKIPSPDLAEQARPLTSTVVDVLTQHNDNQRTGAVLEKGLSPSTVSQSSFGQRFKRHVDGQIYAQLLYANGVANTREGTKNLLIAATMKNKVYAFDADNTSSDPNDANALVWSTDLSSLQTPLPPAYLCNPVDFLSGTLAIGIMATPVIDKAAGLIYLVAETRQGTCPDAGSGGPRSFWVVALSLTNGNLFVAQQIGTTAGSTFNADLQIARAGLLLLPNGGAPKLYVAFSSYGDSNPFEGWVFSYNAPSLNGEQSYCTTCGRSALRAGGGIWQSGSGLAADENGASIYIMTGNGVPIKGSIASYSDNVPGSTPVGEENSFVQLSAATLAVQHRWHPPDFANIDGVADLDLGSGGPLVIPGSGVVGGGKTGAFYVFDRNLSLVQSFQAFDNERLGTAGQPPVLPVRTADGGIPITYDEPGCISNSDCARIDGGTCLPVGGAAQVCSWVNDRNNPPNIHGNPVTWLDPGDGRRRIYAWAEKSRLKSWILNGAVLTTPPSATGAPLSLPIVMPGGALSISGDPTVAGSGIVWATVPEINSARCLPSATAPCDANRSVVPGRLYAFNAINLQVLYSEEIREYAKFNPPTIANGRVYLPTFENEILVFGSRGVYAPNWQTLSGQTVATTARPGVIASSSGIDVFIQSAADRSPQHKSWNGTSWLPSGSWQPLNGTITSNPTVVSSYVFARDLSNGLSYTQSLPSGWSTWASLGGTILSDPAAVSSSGRIDVVAQASDGTLAHKASINGTWQPWVTHTSANPQPALGHALATGARPWLMSSGSNHLDVFARASDSELNHFQYDGTNWSWENLGGVITSDPVAVSWAPGRFDVFALALDNQIAHKYCPGDLMTTCTGASDWSGWETDPFWGMINSAAASPAAVSLGAGRIDLFVRAVDNSIQHMTFLNGSNGPSGPQGSWMWWETVPGDFTSEATTRVSSRGIEVFGRADDGTLATGQHPGGILP